MNMTVFKYILYAHIKVNFASLVASIGIGSNLIFWKVHSRYIAAREESEILKGNIIYNRVISTFPDRKKRVHISLLWIKKIEKETEFVSIRFARQVIPVFTCCILRRAVKWNVSSSAILRAVNSFSLSLWPSFHRVSQYYRDDGMSFKFVSGYREILAVESRAESSQIASARNATYREWRKQKDSFLFFEWLSGLFRESPLLSRVRNLRRN